ncbi:UMP kinase [Enterobacteriaceae endosymbiont of Plateumaris consimilis]|uniref:UMP kinase n=1 Tax=Enterobacteriaceae endosymbiont of Plateumaris consimilis TaxID=2675794 RepID=UPI00144A1A36|nr:UMP kinase [Enterobacteriaceae endosymbiont of Plateumaris consimilis]QJC28642.1 UMP kinase [Enterobacteriaceae endosymbiont of Plateumaris consimilis]
MKIKNSLIYKRVIIKISGEFLQDKHDLSITININQLNYIIEEIKKILPLGIQIGIVIGGGNLFRGKSIVLNNNLDRIIADQMGILATIINGLALYNSMKLYFKNIYLMSSIKINGICDEYDIIKARSLINDNIMILSGGIGNPLFTTDTTASLRGIELEANAILKATKVNGVYSKDPEKHYDAKFYSKLTYDCVLKKKIQVMDDTAFILARDYDIPIHIFNINKSGSLYRILTGETEGTIISL